MADCERLTECMFFNDKLENMPAVAVLLRKLFCHGEYTRCARYRVTKALGNENIPSDLFPGNSLRARVILSLHNGQ